MKIKPTVGRVVLFFAALSAKELEAAGKKRPEQTEQAAQIAAVNADGTVNLGVLQPDGVHGNAVNVELVQEGEKPPTDGSCYCTWMPFQVGQAKAQEADDAKPPKNAKK